MRAAQLKTSCSDIVNCTIHTIRMNVLEEAQICQEAVVSGVVRHTIRGSHPKTSTSYD